MSRAATFAIGVTGGLLCLVVIIVFSLEAIVRTAVERIGTAQTQVPVRLKNVKLSPLAGRTNLEQLVIANPTGYAAPTAVAVRTIAAQLDWASLTSDRLVLSEVLIQGPEITFEGSLSDNNLQTIRKHLLQAAKTSQPSNSSATRASKAVVIRRLRIVDARVNVHLRTGTIEAKAEAIKLKPITIENLGDPDHPVSTADVAAQVFGALTHEAVASIGKTTGNLLGKGTEEAGHAIDRAVDGLKQLFSR